MFLLVAFLPKGSSSLLLVLLVSVMPGLAAGAPLPTEESDHPLSEDSGEPSGSGGLQDKTPQDGSSSSDEGGGPHSFGDPPTDTQHTVTTATTRQPSTVLWTPTSWFSGDHQYFSGDSETSSGLAGPSESGAELATTTAVFSTTASASSLWDDEDFSASGVTGPSESGAELATTTAVYSTTGSATSPMDDEDFSASGTIPPRSESRGEQRQSDHPTDTQHTVTTTTTRQPSTVLGTPTSWFSGDRQYISGDSEDSSGDSENFRGVAGPSESGAELATTTAVYSTTGSATSPMDDEDFSASGSEEEDTTSSMVATSGVSTTNDQGEAEPSGPGTGLHTATTATFALTPSSERHTEASALAKPRVETTAFAPITTELNLKTPHDEGKNQEEKEEEEEEPTAKEQVSRPAPDSRHRPGSEDGEFPARPERSFKRGPSASYPDADSHLAAQHAASHAAPVDKKESAERVAWKRVRPVAISLLVVILLAVMLFVFWLVRKTTAAKVEMHTTEAFGSQLSGCADPLDVYSPIGPGSGQQSSMDYAYADVEGGTENRTEDGVGHGLSPAGGKLQEECVCSWYQAVAPLDITPSAPNMNAICSITTDGE